MEKLKGLGEKLNNDTEWQDSVNAWEDTEPIVDKNALRQKLKDLDKTLTDEEINYLFNVSELSAEGAAAELARMNDPSSPVDESKLTAPEQIHSRIAKNRDTDINYKLFLEALYVVAEENPPVVTVEQSEPAVDQPRIVEEGVEVGNIRSSFVLEGME